jgi:hypothetical protein
MSVIGTVGQLAAALWILNVWVLRFNKETEYRGGEAKNLPQEFDVYGFPKGTVWLVGSAKVSLAILLIVGVWVDALVGPAAGALGILMLAAIAMHLRVGDRLKKSAPAISVLSLCVVALAF